MERRIIIISAVVFSIVALVHLLRIIFNVTVVISNWNVSLWLSIIAVVLAGWLAFSLWEVSFRKR